MIEAALAESRHAPVARSPAPARRQRVTRRYVLSDNVRDFLRAKYLGSEAACAAPASNVRPLCVPLAGLSVEQLAREQFGRSATLRRRVLMGTKLAVLAATLFAFAALALAGEARADTVFAQGGFFTGQQQDQFSFNVLGPGTLSVTLSDLDGQLTSMYGLPANSFSPLSTLTITLWSQAGELGSCSLSAPCSGLTIAAPGTYYAMIDSVAGSNKLFPGLNIGIDQVIGDFSPVPLPASLWLALSGVAATLWSVRRHRASPSRTRRVGAARPREGQLTL